MLRPWYEPAWNSSSASFIVLLDEDKSADPPQNSGKALPIS